MKTSYKRPGKVHVGLWLEPDLVKILDDEATEQDRSRNYIAEKILSTGVTHQPLKLSLKPKKERKAA